MSAAVRARVALAHLPDAGLIELAERIAEETQRIASDDDKAGDRLFYLFRALRALQPRTIAGAQAKALALIALGAGRPLPLARAAKPPSL
jgi:hypothetical protein